MADSADRAPSEWRMDVFTAGRAGGNPAGVILDPPDLSPEEMTRAAVRLNPLSETAFVRPPLSAADATFRLRYFAPGGEVDLCGHATAAAYAALAMAGRLGDLPAGVRSAAPGGDVRGRVEEEEDGLLVWLDMPVARRTTVRLEMEAVSAALGLPAGAFAAEPAPAVEDVGIRVALLPLRDLTGLDAMRPDFDRLRELGRADRITVFYPFVLDPDGGPAARARSFAPAVDIDEDPATGTAAASLGAYLARIQRFATGAEVRIRQGEAMGYPSELRLTIERDGPTPTAIRVGGRVRGGPVEG